MVFVLFIAGLLGMAVFFLFIAGTFLGDLIKEMKMTEEEKTQKKAQEYRDLFNEYGWLEMADIKTMTNNSVEDLKSCEMYDEVVRIAQAFEAENKVTREETAITLEERRLNLELRKQKLQARKQSTS